MSDASVLSVVSITFTIISLTAFILFAYDKIESEFFKMYKAPIFLGSAFLIFAIFGLPYMSYDKAIPPPSFQFLVMAFAAVFVLGTLLVYTTNMTYETYIMAVSCIAMLATLQGRLRQSDGKGEFSPTAQRILYLIMAASVLFGTSKALQGAAIPPDFQPYVSLFVSLVPVGLWGILATGLFFLVRGIAMTAAAQPGYPTSAAYEPFQVRLTQENREPVVATTATTATTATKATEVGAIQRASEVGQTVPVLLQQIQAAIRRIEENGEIILDQTDSTCSLVKDVEQGYVGARAAPTDDSEYDLPKEEQDKRRVAREARAAASFQENRRVYASLRNSVVPLLECFQTQVSEDSAEDLELRAACTELQTLLENQEVLLQVQKSTQVQIALEFANKQLNRAEGFQTAPSTRTLATLRGPALIATAQQLLLRELDLYVAILRNEQELKATQDRVKKQMYKASLVQKGNFNPTTQDLRANGF